MTSLEIGSFLLHPVRMFPNVRRMSSPIHVDLLDEIAAYRDQHGLSRSAFGMRLMGDPRFVADLEQGRELRRRTIAKLRERMQQPPEQTAGAA